MTTRRWQLVGAAAIVVVLAGWYLLLDDRGVPEARTWAENHPTFEQIPQDHWQMTADRAWHLGALEGRILPQLNSLLAARRTVWDVPDDLDTVVEHVASLVQHEGAPTEAFGQLWYQQPGSWIVGFRTDSEPVDDRRRQSVSITVSDTAVGAEVIITASQHERYARR